MDKSLTNLINSKIYSPIDIFLSDRDLLKKGISFEFCTGVDQSFNLFSTLSSLICCPPNFLNNPIPFLENYFKKPPNFLTIFPDEIVEIEIFILKKHLPKQVIFKKDFCLGSSNDLLSLKNNSLLKFNKAFNQLQINIKLISTRDYENCVLDKIDTLINKYTNKNEELKNYFAARISSGTLYSDYADYTSGYFSVQKTYITEHLQDIFLSISFYSEYLDKHGYVSKPKFSNLISSVAERSSIFKGQLLNLEKILKFTRSQHLNASK